MKISAEPKFAWGTFLIGLAVLAVYSPLRHAGFVWDDSASLTRNPLVLAPDGLSRLWFSTESADYWPVTYTSFWLEWRLWGAHALGYHAVNALLHFSECLLLWAILRRLRIAGAFLAALLFAVNPVNVQSVAWITERKNLMAMLFYLLAILFFVRWDDRRRRGDYAASVAAFALAMLSKGSVAMLPLVLFGILLWRRRPGWAEWRAVAPFFAISAVLVPVNAWFQWHAWTAVTDGPSLVGRVLLAGAAPWFYLWKDLFPVDLAVFYGEWRVSAGELRWWLPALAQLAVFGLFWRGRFGWGRPWLYAWAYFCVSLVLAMGFARTGYMRYSFVSDHYQHLASIAVAAMLGWILCRGWRVAVGGAVAVLFAALARQHVRSYVTAEALWWDAARQLPNNPYVEFNLGNAILHEGRTEEGAAHTRTALRLLPSYPEAENDLGVVAEREGKEREAADHYRRAVELLPSFTTARENLCSALIRLGDFPAALAEVERLLKIEPRNAAALARLPDLEYNVGAILARQGRREEAIGHYREALRLKPNFPAAEDNLGVALARTGHPDEAIRHFEAALKFNPNFAEAHENFAVLLGSLGRTEEAQRHLSEAARLRASTP